MLVHIGLFARQTAYLADFQDFPAFAWLKAATVANGYARQWLASAPSIQIVVQRNEWEAGHDPAAIRRNYFYPRDYAVGDREVVLVDGDHDLLGDGSIELLLTPGHTPGHQSVRVGEQLVLGADVAHFSSALEDHRFPAFADDFTAQAQSANRLRRLRDRGARVLPGHDPDVLRAGSVIS